MGKYDKFNPAENVGENAFWWKRILNELAETNRLKIVELQYYLKVNGMTRKEVNMLKELEDQA